MNNQTEFDTLISKLVFIFSALPFMEIIFEPAEIIYYKTEFTQILNIIKESKEKGNNKAKDIIEDQEVIDSIEVVYNLSIHFLNMQNIEYISN